MRILVLFIFATIFLCCKPETGDSSQTELDTTPRYVWRSYNDSLDIAGTQALENPRMHLKLINARGIDKNDIWHGLNGEINALSHKRAKELAPLILEKNIPQIQQQVIDGVFTYEELTRFFLNRIARFESDNDLALNGVIALNTKAVETARALDKIEKSDIDPYSLYGMPILLKDNIGVKGMPTTAGAVALRNNHAEDAFITSQLKRANAIVLGKANLSEWAYFLCSGCPVGYSAIGGQTINPYGRLQFESGGSSSGSGVTVAANYAVAAIGSETSGSILSPASQNNIVGLKPTIGLVSRSGIVPISSHLDTAGPMTKSVIDNAIVLDALIGQDKSDSYSFEISSNYIEAAKNTTLQGVYLGYVKGYLQDSTYAAAIEKLKKTEATLVQIELERIPLPGFLSILNKDMEKDLPAYYKDHVNTQIPNRSIEALTTFNAQDSLNYIPYGQQLFHGILADTTSATQLATIKTTLMQSATSYFQKGLNQHPDAAAQLDAILSINNYDAGYAAVAHYPALTLPMGFSKEGEPKGITVIAPSRNESIIYRIAAGVEQALAARKLPDGYGAE